jgi:hypothetical protein
MIIKIRIDYGVLSLFLGIGEIIGAILSSKLY